MRVGKVTLCTPFAQARAPRALAPLQPCTLLQQRSLAAVTHAQTRPLCLHWLRGAQVSWVDICHMLEWLVTNLRLVDVRTGDTKCFYVDLSNHVYVSLKVPRLRLQTPRCGMGAQQSSRARFHGASA